MSELVTVPIIKEAEYRTESFEARLTEINLSEQTVGERVVQVLKLGFDDNGPDLNIRGVPESGLISDIKPFGKTTDFAHIISAIQSKGINVEMKEGDGRFEVFLTRPSILASKVKMVAVPREYQKPDGSPGKALNWSMEIIELCDNAVSGFVSSPNAPKVPEPNKDNIPALQDVKKLILEKLTQVYAEDSGKYIPTNEIVKHTRAHFMGKPDAEKWITAYSQLREKALSELVDDGIIEKSGNLYKMIL